MYINYPDWLNFMMAIKLEFKIATTIPMHITLAVCYCCTWYAPDQTIGAVHGYAPDRTIGHV